MTTRRDRCIEDLAEWYAKHRRKLTRREMRPIIHGHFPEEADQTTFFDYLASPEGHHQFTTALKGKLRMADSR